MEEHNEKYEGIVWRVLAPVFPFFCKILTFLRVHRGRQQYELGWLSPDKTFDEFKRYLNTQGFRNHFVAWIDDDEAFGVRKKIGLKFQYHLRVFKDREVRGHYEYTPEWAPIAHFREVGMEQRKAEFLAVLGHWITPNKL